MSKSTKTKKDNAGAAPAAQAAQAAIDAAMAAAAQAANDAGESAPDEVIWLESPRGAGAAMARALLARFAKHGPVHYDGWSHYVPDATGVWRAIDEREIARELDRLTSAGLVMHPAVGSKAPARYSPEPAAQTSTVRHTRVVAPPIDWQCTPGVPFADGTFIEVVGRELVQRRIETTDHVRDALTVPYDPGATCPRWLQFLEQVFGQAPDYKLRVGLLQEFFGALLARQSTRYQVALILTGAGENGKSRVLDPLLAMIPRSTRHAISIQNLHNPFYVAMLEGAWLNACGDVDRSDLRGTGPLKQLIDGSEVEADKKGYDPRRFVPTAGHILSCNELPNSPDPSDGFYRRFVVLNFTRQFPVGDPDRDELLSAKLAAEAPGIAIWALDGLRRLTPRGAYVEPPSSLAAKAEWRGASNSAYEYCRERLTTEYAEAAPGLAPPEGSPTEDLWRDYRRWCDDTGRKLPYALNKFAAALSAQGYPSVQIQAQGRRARRVKLWVRRTECVDEPGGWDDCM